MQSIRYRGPDGPTPRQSKEITMSFRFETAQRIALSCVGALFFAAIAVSAATPIIPIA
jgi:hypothetical protein